MGSTKQHNSIGYLGAHANFGNTAHSTVGYLRAALLCLRNNIADIDIYVGDTVFVLHNITWKCQPNAEFSVHELNAVNVAHIPGLESLIKCH